MRGPGAPAGEIWSRLARRPAAVVAAVAALVAGGAAYAAAPVQVSSNPSPFATPGCQALDPYPFNYLGSEVEPMVAVDPTNPSHLVGAWQQDRWLDGGAHGLVAGYSFDGGATWKRTPIPAPRARSRLKPSGPWPPRSGWRGSG